MSKGKHLSIENREVIEQGIVNGDSARKIAKRIGVVASSVTREVMKNRTIRDIKARKGANLAIRCIHYQQCQCTGTACKKCSTRYTSCKRCRTHQCINVCPKFERKMCPNTQKWPYVCPDKCSKRAYCGYPKCSYCAEDADKAYRKRLVETRLGINCTEEELKRMQELIKPLVKQGQSFEAIWASHGSELAVGLRTAYNYQAAGILDIASIDLPRKVRLRPRKKVKACRDHDRVDRSNREYADFIALPIEEQASVVQGDSLCGFENNTKDLLTLHMVAYKFQFYLLKAHASSEAVVEVFDVIESFLGSPEAFLELFGVLLVDRGVEFDDWWGMERSCLVEGANRCRVYYCDAMRSDQKAHAERNHEQARRILPKGRSDFDKLGAYDAATLTSHINSYVGGGRGGMCPFDLATPILPQQLLDELGIKKIPPDEVVLKPSLLAHAVVR